MNMKSLGILTFVGVAIESVVIIKLFNKIDKQDLDIDTSRRIADFWREQYDNERKWLNEMREKEEEP